MQIKTNSEQETIQAAQTFATTLKGHETIALHGTLGMGKSVFARALIRQLCADENLDVPSPTFTLLQTYTAKTNTIFHYDLYRIEDPGEIYELDWESALHSAITLIEWPNKIGALLPENRIDITLSSINDEPNSRSITIEERTS